MKSKKIVYVGLSVDIIHEGHINILKTANKYGDVIVGLLTDDAIASYKNIPHLNYNRRKTVVQNIKYVKKVIPQNTLSYVANLELIKPDVVVHGDDWKYGIQSKTRKDVIKTGEIVKSFTLKKLSKNYKINKKILILKANKV